MVPKSNKSGQSSSKGQGGGSSSSTNSSSLDLYNKMHDYVLSRTPDQSVTNRFLNHTLRSSVAQISLEIGWNTAHVSALDVLADLTGRYLLQFAKQTKKYTDHYGRTFVSEDDIALGLRDMNVSVSELEEYVENFDPVELPRDTPYFPVPRKTDLNFLRPGSEESITRPVHVHEYMPSMIFEQKEQQEDDSDVKKEESGKEEDSNAEDAKVNVNNVSSQEGGIYEADSQSTIQNGVSTSLIMMPMPLVLEEPSQVPDVASELVVSEEAIPPVVVTEEVEIKTEGEIVLPPPVDNEQIVPVISEEEIKEELPPEEEESSDDDIEPGMKAATMNLNFKSTRKLGARVENPAVKRFRKILEEQGLPIRDVTSVIMTSSGFLSESREGRLPECKPPPHKDFFDSEPSPPEKKKKPPTMKKILEGVKKLEKAKSGAGLDDSGDENDADEPSLFGVLDKIVTKSSGANDLGGDASHRHNENGAIVEAIKLKKTSSISSSSSKKNKLSKQEKKLLHQTKKKEKELLKKLKMKSKSKDKALLKQAKSLQAAAALKEQESSSGVAGKSKLKIFSKKNSSSSKLLKAAARATIDISEFSVAGISSEGISSKKKKKDKKNKVRSSKDIKISLARVDENPELLEIAHASSAGQRDDDDMEAIESDEDFSNMTEETNKSVSPLHIINPAAFASISGDSSLPSVIGKKNKFCKSGSREGVRNKMLDIVAAQKQHQLMLASNKRQLNLRRQGLDIINQPQQQFPHKKLALKLAKRPIGSLAAAAGILPDDEGPPTKKKRGRPKKIFTGSGGLHGIPSTAAAAMQHHLHHPSPTGGGPMSLPAAQLADIGKSLMKEPQLNMRKIRKEHMEVQESDHRPHPLRPPPALFAAKPPILSPSKMAPSLMHNADLLKRLPAQPGLIPDHATALVPNVRLPKELSSSISVTPSLSSPQKDSLSLSSMPSSQTSSSSAPRSLASNMCSSVTITRIEMSPQKQLPSRYDDTITPGIGPPPGMESSAGAVVKRNKNLGRPPPLLQIPVPTETESGITITPIVMGGSGSMTGSSGPHGGNKELSSGRGYDSPLPPPPPLQRGPPQKHSMLAKLDEELSSAASSASSKEQRKKEKEKRKELRKEKKKKAKDKSKDKSEKKKKKKDKSGSSTTAASDSSEQQLPIHAAIPKITLKLSGHSNTPTPVDSPNPPQIYHEPPMPPVINNPPPPKKLTFKGLHHHQDEKPQHHKPPAVPHHSHLPPLQQHGFLKQEPEEDNFEMAGFTPLITRPQKPARAAKAHAAAAVAAMQLGSGYSNQEMHFPLRDPKGGGRASRGAAVPTVGDGGDGSGRGRGRPPKGGAGIATAAGSGSAIATPSSSSSSSKQGKSSLTVLETETVGCIIDEQGNKIWICPACGRQDDGSSMIGCDKCDDWYHFICVGITEEPDEDSQWFCQRCQKKKKEGKLKKRK